MPPGESTGWKRHAFFVFGLFGGGRTQAIALLLREKYCKSSLLPSAALSKPTIDSRPRQPRRDRGDDGHSALSIDANFISTYASDAKAYAHGIVLLEEACHGIPESAPERKQCLIGVSPKYAHREKVDDDGKENGKRP